MNPSHSPSSSRLNTWIALAFIYVYLAWGATYMALHYALESLPPFLIGGGRFFLAGALLMGITAIVHRKDFHWGSPREWWDALVIGTVLLVFGNGGVAWAQQYVPTSIAALIFGSIPLFIVFFDWLRPGGVMPSLRTWIGLVVGFIGLCILVKPSAASPDTRMEIWGKAALIFAACSWAAGAIYSRHVHAKGSPLLPMARQMMSGGLVLFVVAYFHGDWNQVVWDRVTPLSWMGFAYLTSFGSLFGFTAYAWLMRTSTPDRVSTVSYVNLVVAVLIGWTIGGETMTARLWFGASIIVGSVVLVLTKKTTRDVVESAPSEA